jgi:cell division protein FtsZ
MTGRDHPAGAQAETAGNADSTAASFHASMNEIINPASVDTPAPEQEVAEAEHVAAMTAVGGGDPVSAPAQNDAFIPPAPASRSRMGMRQDREPAPLAPSGQSVEEAGSEPQRNRPKVASLFASVMGAGRGGRTQKPHVQPEFPREQSAGVAEEGRLGAPSLEERLPSSKQEDDLLDIPAFLRRQAN